MQDYSTYLLQRMRALLVLHLVESVALHFYFLNEMKWQIHQVLITAVCR
jgi:hypothetical protein